jgi:tetratricopeptide (TPR) repeat protein
MAQHEREASTNPNRPDTDIVFPCLTASIADIDRDITSLQNSLLPCPRSHSKRIIYVGVLAEARLTRYRLSQEKEDIDKFIVYCTEAILLPFVSQDRPFVIQLLFRLASALLERSRTHEQPEGIEESINYLWYLQRFPLDSFHIPRTLVTSSLTQALAMQVVWGTGNEARDIKEMVVLCNELLVSKFSDLFTAAFISLSEAAKEQSFRELPIELLDEVIECLRDAVKVCPPASHESRLILLELSEQLRSRFIKAPSLDDYEEATALLEKIIDPNQLGGCPDSIRSRSSTLATVLAIARCVRFSSPEYSEVAISRIRASLSSSSIDGGLRFAFTEALSTLVKDRFSNYGLSENLEEVTSNISQLVGLSSSQCPKVSWSLLNEIDRLRETHSPTEVQQKIQNLEELLSHTSPGTEHHKTCLSGLADWYESKFRRTKDTSDIKESIKYRRLSLDATHANDPWRITLLIFLRNTLFLALEDISDISYLNELITIDCDILESKAVQHLQVRITQGLVHSLCTRERLLGRREDRYEAIRLISVAVDYQNALESDRFRLSCQWAILARSIRHPTTLNAYRSAMSLMQRSLSFAPTVSIQHTRLVEMGKECQMMPLDYASYQINLGQFEEAIETLEQGRALIWSEMRGLRTPVAIEDCVLARRFAEINQELEVMTTSITPSGRPEIEGGVAQDGSDPFGRLVIKQKKLVDERDALISLIQSQPGSEGFLRAPSFSALRSAASRGPIILINHCFWRSDIVTILFLAPFIPPMASLIGQTNSGMS